MYFEISIYSKKHIFKAELLEDLYVFLKGHWKKQDGRLYDCACKVVENTGNTIIFFETVFGKSLNELYKNTYVHFFSNQGNPACNALDRFCLDENMKDSNMIRKRCKF